MTTKTAVGCVIACLAIFATPAVHSESLTIFYTNDIESVYEPVASPWRDDMAQMGGIAHLSALINAQRSAHQNSILVDAGDMFTGSLSKATEGRLVFDIYSEMGYDAANLGNHEFEYGWQTLRKVMPRARFPLLNANIYYENTDIPFSQPYTILKAGKLRIGVIGLMGVDAFNNTIMRANRKGLAVNAPADVTQALIDSIRHEVDFLLLLTHQNRTAPMQTNKESDPSVLRGFDEDYALAGAMRGVDMIVGGHSDHGLLEPVTHPETGTVIGLTFGQGMHLGFATFEVGDNKSRLVNGGLIPVDSDRLTPNPEVVDLINTARNQHLHLTQTVTQLDTSALRSYYGESALGSLLADALQKFADAEFAMVPAGAIRADLQAGDVTIEDLLNVFPFTDKVSVMQIGGDALLNLFEKGVSLDYGLSQFSGITLTYDSRQPVGERVVEVLINDQPIDITRSYRFATVSFTATGGEGYNMFSDLQVKHTDTLVSDAFIKVLGSKATITPPSAGRLIDVSNQ